MQEQFLGDIIVFAAIAVFIILRYRNTLGQKKGHDFSNPKPQAPNAQNEKVVRLHEQTERMIKEQNQKENDLIEKLENDDITADIVAMKEIDASFTLDGFIVGARQAYEMVLEAFSKQDKDTLKVLLSKDLYKDFEKEIDEQKKDGKHTETTLVSIEEAELKEADLTKSTATITLTIRSEQINVVRNEEGEILEGDAADIQNVEDVWTFQRDLKSRNPNWTIIDT